jgi:hypothetical protein
LILQSISEIATGLPNMFEPKLVFQVLPKLMNTMYALLLSLSLSLSLSLQSPKVLISKEFISRYVTESE